MHEHAMDFRSSTVASAISVLVFADADVCDFVQK
jgi:hypothetical protein